MNYVKGRKIVVKEIEKDSKYFSESLDKLLQLVNPDKARVSQHRLNLSEAINELTYLLEKVYDIHQQIGQYHDNPDSVDLADLQLRYVSATKAFHRSIYGVIALYNHLLWLLGIFISKHRSVENSLKIWDHITTDEVFHICLDHLKISYTYRSIIDHPKSFPALNWWTAFGEETTLIVYYQESGKKTSFERVYAEFNKFKLHNKIFRPLEIRGTVIDNPFPGETLFVVPPSPVVLESLLYYLHTVNSYFIHQEENKSVG